MTIANETNRTSAVGTGAEQIVPFTFPITNNSDIVVTSRITATGVETTMVETTDYTVINNGASGGSITTVTPFIASTLQIHIVRDTPNTQGTDLQAGGAFSAENVEDAFDKNTKLTIENAELLGNTPTTTDSPRVLRFPATDPVSSLTMMPNSIDRASKNLTFDSAGNPTASVVVEEGSVSFTVIGTNIAEAADVNAERTLLGLATGDDVVFNSVTADLVGDVTGDVTGDLTGDVTGDVVSDDIITKSPWVDIRAFLPPDFVIDGTVDYTTEIQTAIDAGDNILFPSGSFRISSPLVVTSTSTSTTKIIKGNGAGSTDGSPSTHNTVILNNGDDDAFLSRAIGDVIIQDLTIDDNLSSGARTIGAGIHTHVNSLNANTQITVRNVWVQGHQDGIRLERPILTLIERVTCEASERNCFRVEADANGGGTSTVFQNTWARDAGADGYSIEGLSYSSLISCASDGSAVDGYKFHATNQPNNAISVVSCGVENSTGNGYSVSGGICYIFMACEAITSGSDGWSLTGGRNMTLISCFGETNTAYDVDTTGITSREVAIIEPRFIGSGTGDILDPGPAIGFNLERDKFTIGAAVIKKVRALANDGTPDVTKNNIFTTGGTTAITDFTNGLAGQEITVMAAHAVTITDGGNLTLAGSNFAMDSGDVIKLVSLDGTEWLEISRSNNN